MYPKQLILEKEINEIDCQIKVPDPAGICIAIIKDRNGMVLWEEKIIKE
ncbi:MAG: hypothetical protein KAS71_11670 [Bacteroidales bacterium]|nr:hypothetical protein [Bacteroidales bacterium]